LNGHAPGRATDLIQQMCFQTLLSHLLLISASPISLQFLVAC